MLRPLIMFTVGAFLFVPASTYAGVITFTNSTVDQSGTGFGTILNVLSVSQTANGTTEFGKVSWDGANVVETGEATAQSESPSVAQMLAAGIDGNDAKFALIFNINEPGNATGLKLNDFTLDFYAKNGALLFSVKFDAGPLDLVQVGSGQGAAGYLFEVELTPAEKLAFFADPDNHVGQTILSGNAISNVSGGAENFYIANINGSGPGPGPGPNPSAVPEPTSLLAWGCIGLGMAGAAWRRRNRTAVTVS
jgi:hypothetical protein